MPKNSSTSIPCPPYKLRSNKKIAATQTAHTSQSIEAPKTSYSLHRKESISKIDVPKKTQPSIKKQRAVKKNASISKTKLLPIENDEFEITEQIAKEWIARSNAPPSDSATDWLVADAQAPIDEQEEQKKIDEMHRLLLLEAIRYNQNNALLQMQEYQKRQEWIDAQIRALTPRIDKMGNDLEQLRKIHVPVMTMGFFSQTSERLADMEPRMPSDDLEISEDFSLSLNQI